MTLRASGTRTLPGYATVSFSTPLSVTAGRSFVVAVKLSRRARPTRSPIERPARYWMRGRGRRGR